LGTDRKRHLIFYVNLRSIKGENVKKYTIKIIIFLSTVAVIFTSLRAQTLTEKIDAIVEQYVQLDQFSGTLLVAKDGQPLYAKAFGEANKDLHVRNTLETKYNIGSAGKTFTAIAIMQLVEQGKLKVEDPVISILPEFPFGDKILIKHLLTHTSGTYNYFAHPDFRTKMFTIRSVSDALPLIYDQKLRFDTPGEQFSYSNSGIVILGAVIEKLSGQKYADYLEDYILSPLKMDDTGINYLEDIVENRAVGYTQSVTGTFKRNIFSVPPANADGGIETTVFDLLKYDQALYENKILNRESKKKMFTPYKNDYAFCWGVENLHNNTVIGHGGGAPGVSAVFRRYIDDQYTLIILSNYSGGAPPVANTIEAIIFNAEYDQPKPRLGNYLYTIIKDKGGDYLLENFTQILKEGNYTIRSSNMLNMIGYTLIREDLPKIAIQIFELNTRLYPKEANPYDSLAEAYMISGDIPKSKENYQKALKLDPNYENSQRMLKKLEKMQAK